MTGVLGDSGGAEPATPSARRRLVAARSSSPFPPVSQAGDAGGARVVARQRSPEATTVAACSAIVVAWPTSVPVRITTSGPVRRAVARDAGAPAPPAARRRVRRRAAL